MKILLTGVAGSGKSTIVKELQRRGYDAVDLHGVPGMFYWEDKKTKEKVQYTPGRSREWFQSVVRFCDLNELKKVIGGKRDIFVAATAGGNQTSYFPLFDKIILLHCDPETLVHRMETRVNRSGFGKSKSEQEDVIEWQKDFEPFVLSHGAISVDTNGDIGDVADEIVRISIP